MDFSFISKYYFYFIQGAQWTIVVALSSVIIGVILALLLTLLKRSKISVFRWLAVAYIELIRGTPLLLQIYIVYFGFGEFIDIEAGPACIIALSLNSAAYVSELIRAGIEAVDIGQMEAARSLGMTEKKAMRLIIIPQAIKNILPAIGNEFVAIIKESSMASVLGVKELMYGSKVVGSTTYNYLEALMVAAVFYFIMTFSLGRLMGYLERRMKVSDRS